ncbi:MAG: hypothetical protein OTI36_10085, partial [Beijerinckiaceae bacterium]|nr:hypothetical protein [Beijerinckiaceae bacterium]
MIPHPSRRTLLAGGGALFGAAMIPKVASAAGARDPRLVVLVLRGALDGLAAVGPIGDPDYVALHGQLAMRLDGPAAALPLDGFFALNPGMPNFARMVREKTGVVVHATATGYRDRSHFDGQDVLESGMPAPGFVESGWLNRSPAGSAPSAKTSPKNRFTGKPRCFDLSSPALFGCLGRSSIPEPRTHRQPQARRERTTSATQQATAARRKPAWRGDTDRRARYSLKSGRGTWKLPRCAPLP